MDEDIINTALIEDIRDYLKLKTGKLYFKHIRAMPDNIQVTCPFHKDGQENKPSATIRVTASDRAAPGLFSCFTCHEAMMIDEMVAKILGSLYNEDEVEAKLGLKSIRVRSSFIKPKKEILFKIPERKYISNSILRKYEGYHPYLKSRNISEEVAKIYNIGFDKDNNQIIFPIYNIEHKCLGLGRRSIDRKLYRYPQGFQKPLYGIYELDRFLNYVYIVEGPFNLWSLREWNKQAVGLLGTGTEFQYKQLLTIDCKGYVCSLDNDDAGIRGTKRLIDFLISHKKRNIHVAVYPRGKDVNDLTYEEFRQIPVYTYKEWLLKYNKILSSSKDVNNI